jgi:hypothetical protein
VTDVSKADALIANATVGSYLNSIVESVTFTDYFDRADQNLEGDGNWTRIGGSAGWGLISSGAVRSNTTNTNGAAYVCRDLQSASQYVEAQFLSDNSPGFVAVRLSDFSNFIGLRYANAAIEVYKKVAGTFAFVASAASLRGNSLFRLEYNAATGMVRVLKDGTQIIAPIAAAVGSMPASTRAGLIVRSAVAPLLDKFTAGAM